VAVLLVLLYHAHLPPFRGGFIGVDVFFVLSGFLITSLLLRELGRTGTVSLANFWARRARRLLPASGLVLVATLVASRSMLDGLSQAELARDAIAASAFVVNIRFMVGGTDYLASQLPPSPLLHFWSLAVEEQFYLAWPLVVWALPPRRLAVACLGIVAGAFALRFAIHHTTYNATAAYVLTPARMDALALGALVAVAARVPGWWPRARRAAPWVLGASAAAVAAVWIRQGALFGGDPVAQVWAFGPLAAGFAAVLVLAIDGRDAGIARPLASPALRTLGKYSYGLYVLHYPIFLGLEAAGLTAGRLAGLAGSRLLGIAAFTAIAGTATFGAALLSWRFLERPFLRLKNRVPYRSAAAPAPASPGALASGPIAR